MGSPPKEGQTGRWLVLLILIILAGACGELGSGEATADAPQQSLQDAATRVEEPESYFDHLFGDAGTGSPTGGEGDAQ